VDEHQTKLVAVWFVTVQRFRVQRFRDYTKI